MENRAKRRQIRAKKTRLKLAELQVKRLLVYKSNMHVYAQIYDETGSKVLVCASTLDKDLKIKGANVANAKVVGEVIAKKALSLGIQKLSFDRSGFKYHGCIKVLADSAREFGLVF